MNILAIDLGTQCGWALGTRDGKVRSGSRSFAAGKNDGPGLRWIKFRNFLTETGRSVGEIHAVYYEDVKRHGPGQVIAAHTYGGFLAHLHYWCELNRIPCKPVGVGQIKKHWTGSGVAKKEQMIAAAEAKGFKVEDDNHADALAILSIARQIELGGLVLPKKPKKKKVRKSEKVTQAAEPALFEEAY